MHKTTTPISRKSCTILSLSLARGWYISISQKKKRHISYTEIPEKYQAAFSWGLGVYIDTMKSILALCSEYSDNAWYSEFDTNSVPTKIAIEIGRKYRFAFLKLMARYGYSLHSTRRGDSENIIITLERVSNAVFAN